MSISSQLPRSGEIPWTSQGNSAPAANVYLSPIHGSEAAVAALLITAVAGMMISRFHRCRHSGAHDFRFQEPLPATGPYFAGDWELSSTRYCPICRAEFLGGTPECEDCGVELVEEEDLPDRDIRIQESVVRIARLDDAFNGLLIRNVLSANEVPCSVHRSIWDAAGANVYVFESDAVRAKRLLKQYFGFVTDAGEAA